MTNPALVELEPDPIPSEWILSGNPNVRCKKVARSQDLMSHIVVWDCTAGQFKWEFALDEVIVVVSGEAFMIDQQGTERRFGPGDFAFFPAGSSCRWRVEDHIKKIGILREPVWAPLGVCLKIWQKILRIVGLSQKSPLAIALAALTLHNSMKS